MIADVQTAGALVLRCEAMGTTFELVLVAGGREHGRLQAIGEAVFDCIREVESRWSLFLPDSRLAQLNRTGHLRALALDADDLELFRVAALVKRESGGAFDPNVASAMDAAGHFASRGLAACLGSQDDSDPESTWVLDESGSTVRFTGSGPALDLGGIAKGHALDLAARELREYGVEDALLHGGTSSVIALGAPPGQEAWTVEVNGSAVLLRDQALAVSDASSQSVENDSHILIPGTSPNTTCAQGQSAPTQNSAAVRCDSAALADAWATALCANPALAQIAAPHFSQQNITLLA